MIRLILTSDLRDLWKAATKTRLFADCITAREGTETSPIQTFHALLLVRPWATLDSRCAPWRVIRDQISMLPEPIRLPFSDQ